MEAAREDLLAAGVFHCTVCKELLTRTVWLTPDNSNLCDDCYQQRKEDFPLALKDTRFTGIFENLLFPCRYRNEGCEKTMPYSDYLKHVRGCPHASQTCLLAGCQWSGTYKTLMIHLCDHHADIVLDEKDGVFPLQLGDEKTEAINVVQTQHARLVTRIKVTVEKVQVAIFNFDHGLEQDVGEFALEYASDPDASTRHKCKISDDIGSLQALDANTGTEFVPVARLDVSSLKLCKISGEKRTISKRLLQHVTCSECKKYLQKPFFRCKDRHYTCSGCFKKSACWECRTPQVRFEDIDRVYCEQCKQYSIQVLYAVWRVQAGGYLCRVCIRSTSNQLLATAILESPYIFNDILKDFEFPCQFMERGCKFTGPLCGKHRRHEEVCDYNKLTCPEFRCIRVMRYPQLLLHMMTNHKETSTTNNPHCFTHDCPTLMTETFKFFLICHNKLFVHEFHHNFLEHKFEWNLNEIQGNNDHFVFNFDMTGCNDPTTSLQHPCGTKVVWPVEVVKGYIMENQLSYILKVTKIIDFK